MAKVSLIIPCYNAELYIGKAIDSVLSQTFKNIELIIVNDGSTDFSEEVILSRKPEIEAVLSDFKYFIQENTGAAGACQTGYKNSTGDYLMLLDADDYIFPTSIEKQKSFLEENTDFAAVRTNGYYTYSREKGEKEYLLENDTEKNDEISIWQKILLGKAHAFSGGYMIRMSVLDEVYPNREIYVSRYGQNLQFLLSASYHRKVGFIDEPLLKYYIRDDSMTHKIEKDQKKREIELLEGFKSIRVQLIKYLFYEEEKEEYLKKIEILYTKMYLRIASKYRDKALADENYKRLRFLTENNIDNSERRLFYSTKFPIYQLLNALIGKIRRRIKRLFAL